MSGFSPSKVENSRSKNTPVLGSHLGSMRNLNPSSNDAGSRAFETNGQVHGQISFVDNETGQILICEHLETGALKVVDPAQNRLERWILQSAIRHLLKEKRVAKCCRLRAKGQETINVLHNSLLQSAHFAGLQTCGSVWDCPVCAAKISERRRIDEVLPAMLAWESQGGQCLLLTLTNPHFIHSVLADLVKGQQKAMSRFVGRKAYRLLMSEMGCIGAIRAWEVTHGLNGFHPHFHIILFVRTDLDLKGFEDRFYSLWANACRLAKLPIPDRLHGVQLQDGSKAHAYATKGVWGLDHEITKGHLKKSNKGRSPMDLIRSYVYDDDKQAGALFVEYSKAFHGKRQLYWSPGLKERFCIGEKTDEQIASEQDETAILLGRIEWPVWQQVLKSELRGEILELAGSGSWDGVALLLDGLCSSAVSGSSSVVSSSFSSEVVL
jgi:hypothetical protein